MSVNHTPGPWRITGHDQRCVVSDIGPNEIVGVADCRIVDHDYSTNVANAQLIAAAPELFAICKLLADDVAWSDEKQSYRLGPYDNSPGGKIDLLHKAIAKAEGR